MSTKCKNTTAYSQNILHGDALYNIKRKKYKTNLQNCHSPISSWTWSQYRNLCAWNLLLTCSSVNCITVSVEIDCPRFQGM